MSKPPSVIHRGSDVTAAQLAAIVDSSHDAITSEDLNGIVLTWNRGAEVIFGFTAEEMIGQSIRRLIPDTRLAGEEAILAQICQGGSIAPYDTERLTRRGRVLEVSVTVSPITDGVGTRVGFSKIARDITATRHRERELTRLSQLYVGLSQVNQAIVMSKTQGELLTKICRVLVDFSGFKMAWIAHHDADSRKLVPVAACGDQDGYLKNLTISTEDRIEGHGPIGTSFRENRYVISNDLLNDPSTQPWRDQLRMRDFRASAAIPIHCQGQPWGTLVVYAGEADFFREREIALLKESAGDISYALDNFVREDLRRCAEDKVRQERDFSEALINSLPGVVYFYDRAGRFLRWNNNFERVTGYTSSELASMHPLDLFPDAEKALVAARIGKVFELGEATIESDFLAKDGSLTPYYFTGVQTLFDGRPCLVGVGIDISERKRAERALREAHEKMEQNVERRTEELRVALERAEAADRVKSAFLATMSHELRTPLNSIIGFTGIVLQGLAGPLNAEQTKQLGMVRSSARHLLELINDVLDISKIEAGQLEVHPEPFDLRSSLERTIGLIRPMVDKKGLGLCSTVSDEIGQMVSDRRRIEQILLNLLNNAVKFTEHGSVSLAAVIVPEFRAAAQTAPCTAVQIKVTDTGVGIKPQDLTKLFQPFRQVDSGLARLHEGTGLGLAICRRLVTMLGGTILVASEWSRGSVFTVTLPLQAPTPA
ncbi:MAG TPA: PAS domain S-box protein [Opitutaceae bacterium]|nr:PAS domain S-box protein [Opitutaceae bacterium]